MPCAERPETEDAKDSLEAVFRCLPDGTKVPKANSRVECHEQRKRTIGPGHPPNETGNAYICVSAGVISCRVP
jgi:hypothetical protein